MIPDIKPISSDDRPQTPEPLGSDSSVENPSMDEISPEKPFIEEIPTEETSIEELPSVEEPYSPVTPPPKKRKFEMTDRRKNALARARAVRQSKALQKKRDKAEEVMVMRDKLDSIAVKLEMLTQATLNAKKIMTKAPTPEPVHVEPVHVEPPVPLPPQLSDEQLSDFEKLFQTTISF